MLKNQDVGSIDKKIKIAYKPQYLRNDIDVEVISILEKANGGPIEGSQEEEQILDPLKIRKLYNKSIKKSFRRRTTKNCSCIMFNSKSRFVCAR